jgi:endo-1,4-beta-xylanase
MPPTITPAKAPTYAADLAKLAELRDTHAGARERVLDAVKNSPQSIAGDAYLRLWNAAEHARIDADIERHRKVDAVIGFSTADAPPEGAIVRVEQISHAFVFGTHLFNYDQLGSDEANTRHQALFGPFFNAGTIAFYWRDFEPEEGRLRFAAGPEDSAAFWNQAADPKTQPHWRRPATDPVVEFCERKNLRLHGHTLVWGNCNWSIPDWLHAQVPAEWLVGATIRQRPMNERHLYPALDNQSPAQIAARFPEHTRGIHAITARRILEIALHYRDRLHSWDVVNESAIDDERGLIVPDDAACRSRYGDGFLPGDYPYRSLKIAEAGFPRSVLLNINDYHLTDAYRRQTRELLGRGCKIDILGAQMHLFDPKTCLNMVEGLSDQRGDTQTPAAVRETMDCLGKVGLPIHLSEITIASPTEAAGEERGQLIQALIARNLYRLWFSLRPMMGITWWNSIDGCGAAGEPAVSGLFKRDMTPKASFHVLDDLINHEWKTRLDVPVETYANGCRQICFRGFPGEYRLTWTDAEGRIQELNTTVRSV